MRTLIVVLFLLLISIPSYAATVTLIWEPPTTNVDGTPLTDLAGYKVYHGTSSRQYGAPSDVGNVITYQVTGLGEQTYYFSVTAYDTSGNESAYSNEVNKSIKIQPGPPNLTGAEVSIQVIVK